MKKTDELRSQSMEQLTILAEDLFKEIYHLRNEKKMTKNVEKPHLLKDKRKQRARVLSVLTEKRREDKAHG